MQLIGSDNFSIVIGLGKTGLSCARYLAAKGTPFAVADTREAAGRILTLFKPGSFRKSRCVAVTWMRTGSAGLGV